jgi:uncharacterized protein (DUF58 family)
MRSRLTWGIVIAAVVVVAATVLGLVFGFLTIFLLAGTFVAAVVLVNTGRLRSRGEGRPSQRVDNGSWGSKREE